jgi:3'-phosphoadenosine 5'-phosphosulfate sulfotransferase (PAPS reductase)/FAD synthetase
MNSTQHRAAIHPVSRFSAADLITAAREIDALLRGGAACAIGVSGGKDSQACALAVADHLERIGHVGPRVLVHADLGRVEWSDSATICDELAAHLGWELLTVRRSAGDMMARWEGRWSANLARYRTLSCVRLILPWSTPSMRFCTSELKTDVICRALKKRYGELPIVNVTGVRREESTARANMPLWQAQDKLKRERLGLVGVTWNAIIDQTLARVLDCIEQSGLRLHEAYTRYNSSRVSCAFCIMSAIADLLAASTCEANHAVYRLMVELECLSTFAFQGNRWLADVAPHLLSAETLARVAWAKEAAVRRQAAEARVPKHLLYTAGWPTVMPTAAEAELIASVRRDVAATLGIEVEYDRGDAVYARYAELMATGATKTAARAAKLSTRRNSQKRGVPASRVIEITAVPA